MHILIDIGHPAHVHFYRHFIKSASRTDKIIVVARDKEVTTDLLDSLGIEHICRGTGGGSSLSKCFYLIKLVLRLMRLIRQHDIDVLTGIGNPYVALAGFFTRRPSIIFNDTEHAAATVRILRIFATVILTPVSYLSSEGKPQLRYPGFHELAYLHPNRFTPDPDVLAELGLQASEVFVVLRFVAWQATHDIGHTGLGYAAKRQIVEALSEYARVFVSSEDELPGGLQKYQLCIPPEKMHDVLSYASLYIGEGATMASECVMLGTPAIYVNDLTAGTIEEQQRYGLLIRSTDVAGVIDDATRLLQTPDLQTVWRRKHHKMLSEKIDVTDFMLWFFENFPASTDLMKNNACFPSQSSDNCTSQGAPRRHTANLTCPT